MTTNDDVWAEFMDVAGGDPARAAVIRMSLRKLAMGTSGDLLKEMARSVLSGRVGFREAVASDVYGPAFGEGFGKFWAKHERLPEARRKKTVAEGTAQLGKIRARLAADTAAAPGAARRGGAANGESDRP
jgi:hypothetical protein